MRFALILAVVELNLQMSPARGSVRTLSQAIRDHAPGDRFPMESQPEKNGVQGWMICNLGLVARPFWNLSRLPSDSYVQVPINFKSWRDLNIERCDSNK